MSIENNSFDSDTIHDFHQTSVELPSVYGEHYKKSNITSSTPKRRTSKVHFILNPGSGMLMSSSRQEFLPGESNGGIKYKRKGGVFITRCCGFFICFGVIALLAIACTLVYFFGTDKDLEKTVEDDLSWNVGQLHVRTAGDTVRLINSVKPSFYRLKIRPNLTSFTFEGNVAITLSTHKSNVKHISLHIKDLEILNSTTLMEQNIIFNPISKQLIRGRRQLNETDSSKLNITVLNNEINQGLLPGKFVTNSSNGKNTTAGEISQDKNSTSIILKNNTLSVNNGTVVVSHLSQSKPKRMKIISKELDPAIDRLIFALDSHLKPKTNYTLVINFKGKIDDSLTGFYRSTYKDKLENTTKVLAVTQFEPISARKAFPCFDEPEFKAMFEISIGCHKNYTATSNMPLSSQEMDADNVTIWSHFQRSLPMAPYLVAYAITDFESRNIPMPPDRIFKQDLQLKVWARKQFITRTNFVADIAPKILNFYERYFNISYMLPKLDLFPIPDFSVGAMENWGMITFRETALLVDEANGSIKNKKDVAMIIAHELAHQWFGNLVTMRWWNDLWLNEGFATYMEYIGVNQISPEWGLLDQFFIDRMVALGVDNIHSTHPVSGIVNDETLITQIFDDISYKKAASLLRMLNNILTDEYFRKGLNKYMMTWQFKNADQNDLWDAFTSVIENKTILPKSISVSAFMNSWTLETGYPVINVFRNDENQTVTVTQKRFTLHSGIDKQKEKNKQLWYVPLSYTYANISFDKWKTEPVAWLEKKEKTYIKLPDNTNQSWIYFNVLGIGHYRVNYDMKNWKLLEYGLYDEPKDFPPVTKAQLLDDAFEFAKAGQLNYTVPLDLTKYMIEREDSYLPWYSALDNLQLLYIGMHRSIHFNLFLEYVSRLITPTLTEIGYSAMENDSLQDTQLRDYLISWACLIEDSDCLKWAKEKFESWINQTDPDIVNPIPKNSRTTVYASVLWMGSKKEYDFLFERFIKSNDPEVKSEIIVSLPSTRTIWILNSLLEYSITEMDVQITPILWGGFISDIARKRAFYFVLENWDRIYARYSKVDDQLLQHIINGAFGNIGSEQELRQFKRFINAHKQELSSVSKVVYKKVEEAVLRIQWAKTKMGDIERWLKHFSETKPKEELDELSTLYDEPSGEVFNLGSNEDTFDSLVIENPLDFAFYMG